MMDTEQIVCPVCGRPVFAALGEIEYHFTPSGREECYASYTLVTSWSIYPCGTTTHEDTI